MTIKNGNIKFIDKLVLDDTKLLTGEVLLCRIAEFLPLIVVHDDIKN